MRFDERERLSIVFDIGAANSAFANSVKLVLAEKDLFYFSPADSAKKNNVKMASSAVETKKHLFLFKHVKGLSIIFGWSLDVVHANVFEKKIF